MFRKERQDSAKRKEISAAAAMAVAKAEASMLRFAASTTSPRSATSPKAATATAANATTAGFSNAMDLTHTVSGLTTVAPMMTTTAHFQQPTASSTLDHHHDDVGVGEHKEGEDYDDDDDDDDGVPMAGATTDVPPPPPPPPPATEEEGGLEESKEEMKEEGPVGDENVPPSNTAAAAAATAELYVDSEELKRKAEHDEEMRKQLDILRPQWMHQWMNAGCIENPAEDLEMATTASRQLSKEDLRMVEEFEQDWKVFLKKNTDLLSIGTGKNAPAQGMAQLHMDIQNEIRTKQAVEKEMKQQLSFFIQGREQMEAMYAKSLEEAQALQDSIHDYLKVHVDYVHTSEHWLQQHLPLQHFLEALDGTVDDLPGVRTQFAKGHIRGGDPPSGSERGFKPTLQSMLLIHPHLYDRHDPPGDDDDVLLGANGSLLDQVASDITNEDGFDGHEHVDMDDVLYRAYRLDHAILSAQAQMLEKECQRLEKTAESLEPVGKFLTEYNIWGILTKQQQQSHSDIVAALSDEVAHTMPLPRVSSPIDNALLAASNVLQKTQGIDCQLAMMEQQQQQQQQPTLKASATPVPAPIATTTTVDGTTSPPTSIPADITKVSSPSSSTIALIQEQLKGGASPAPAAPAAVTATTTPMTALMDRDDSDEGLDDSNDEVAQQQQQHVKAPAAAAAEATSPPATSKKVTGMDPTSPVAESMDRISKVTPSSTENKKPFQKDLSSNNNNNNKTHRGSDPPEEHLLMITSTPSTIATSAARHPSVNRRNIYQHMNIRRAAADPPEH